VFHQESLDWEIIPFEESIVKVKSSSKIKKRDFLETGSYPIISQEADYINGYWENESDLLTIESPVVAFGDHTKTLKYIDFDFVRGADGLKVLQPREFILPKFFYHYLRSIQLETLGYARHYRLLKQVEIRFPGMDEQHQIASMFDELDKQAFQAKELDEQELHSLDELKRSLLQEAFSGKLTGGIAA
jgi:type I restriction enzyme S subunit